MAINLNEELQEIMSQLLADKFFINDHNSGDEKLPLSNWAIVKLTKEDGEEELCPASMDAFVTCMNPLYIGKDGHVHLSTWSVGGNLWNLDIERYNREFSPDNKDGYHVNQHLEMVYNPDDELVVQLEAAMKKEA